MDSARDALADPVRTDGGRPDRGPVPLVDQETPTYRGSVIGRLRGLLRQTWLDLQYWRDSR